MSQPNPQAERAEYVEQKMNMTKEEFEELAEAYAESCGETGECSPVPLLRDMYEGKEKKGEEWDCFTEFVVDYP